MERAVDVLYPVRLVRHALALLAKHLCSHDAEPKQEAEQWRRSRFELHPMGFTVADEVVALVVVTPALVVLVVVTPAGTVEAAVLPVVEAAVP